MCLQYRRLQFQDHISRTIVFHDTATYRIVSPRTAFLGHMDEIDDNKSVNTECESSVTFMVKNNSGVLNC